MSFFPLPVAQRRWRQIELNYFVINAFFILSSASDVLKNFYWDSPNVYGSLIKFLGVFAGNRGSIEKCAKAGR